jgi:hypothetical protein
VIVNTFMFKIANSFIRLTFFFILVTHSFSANCFKESSNGYGLNQGLLISDY